jgi:hypothetical protein
MPGANPGGNINLSKAQLAGSFNNCGLPSCEFAAIVEKQLKLRMQANFS